ncbi:MAG TPA: TrkA C-terminal domain-containing protein, partial [Ilumatobacteraceae bacterium]|nr:TrkA C-terminal domain-containing protein [Ilumatobacteraceae bacterium]
GELLGTNQVSSTVAAVQRLDGVAMDWLDVPSGSQQVGRTIGDGQYRTKTGASIVAIVRGDTTMPAPGPETAFEAGDVVVAVGTSTGLQQLRDLLVS